LPGQAHTSKVGFLACQRTHTPGHKTTLDPPLKKQPFTVTHEPLSARFAKVGFLLPA
jgi:hypothetical protein